ncbi:MAG: DUF4472 domain-containing protein [Archaeoglobaceae archaeon]
MIWLLLASLTFFANPGSEIQFHLNESTTLVADDPCIFFEETLQSKANLSPGVHKFRVGINCSPGFKAISANDSNFAVIIVSQIGFETILNYAGNLEKENIQIKNNISSLEKKVKELEIKLNETEAQITKLENEKKLLTVEKSMLEDSYKSLQDRFNTLSRDLENRKAKITQMEEEIRSLAQQSSNYRIATLFLISIFVGSFVATAVMMRRS